MLSPAEKLRRVVGVSEHLAGTAWKAGGRGGKQRGLTSHWRAAELSPFLAADELLPLFIWVMVTSGEAATLLDYEMCTLFSCRQFEDYLLRTWEGSIMWLRQCSAEVVSSSVRRPSLVMRSRAFSMVRCLLSSFSPSSLSPHRHPPHP